jgi:hypothetical protein
VLGSDTSITIGPKKDHRLKVTVRFVALDSKRVTRGFSGHPFFLCRVHVQRMLSTVLPGGRGLVALSKACRPSLSA